jgi:hypothetical protein
MKDGEFVCGLDDHPYTKNPSPPWNQMVYDRKTLLQLMGNQVENVTKLRLLYVQGD